MTLGTPSDTSEEPDLHFLERSMIPKDFSVVISERPDSYLLEQDCLERIGSFSRVLL